MNHTLGMVCLLPSGNDIHSLRYRKWPIEIADLPINSMVDLSSSFCKRKKQMRESHEIPMESKKKGTAKLCSNDISRVHIYIYIYKYIERERKR